MTKQLHAAPAPEAGIIAAQLAANGFTRPLMILEGGEDSSVPHAGKPNRMPRFVIPMPLGTTPAIDAALVSDNYPDRSTTTILAGSSPETGPVRKRGLQLFHSA